MKKWYQSVHIPHIDPYDTIREDEITFSLKYTREIAVQDFKHPKSYPLPDNLKDVEKEPLPLVEK